MKRLICLFVFVFVLAGCDKVNISPTPPPSQPAYGKYVSHFTLQFTNEDGYFMLSPYPGDGFQGEYAPNVSMKICGQLYGYCQAYGGGSSAYQPWTGRGVKVEQCNNVGSVANCTSSARSNSRGKFTLTYSTGPITPGPYNSIIRESMINLDIPVANDDDILSCWIHVLFARYEAQYPVDRYYGDLGFFMRSGCSHTYTEQAPDDHELDYEFTPRPAGPYPQYPIFNTMSSGGIPDDFDEDDFELTEASPRPDVNDLPLSDFEQEWVVADPNYCESNFVISDDHWCVVHPQEDPNDYFIQADDCIYYIYLEGEEDYQYMAEQGSVQMYCALIETEDEMPLDVYRIPVTISGVPANIYVKKVFGNNKMLIVRSDYFVTLENDDIEPFERDGVIFLPLGIGNFPEITIDYNRLAVAFCKYWMQDLPILDSNKDGVFNLKDR